VRDVAINGSRLALCRSGRLYCRRGRARVFGFVPLWKFDVTIDGSVFALCGSGRLLGGRGRTTALGFVSQKMCDVAIIVCGENADMSGLAGLDEFAGSIVQEPVAGGI
jgi:hypothetical protein